MTPIEKLGVEISDFLEQNALVWPNSLRQAWDAAKDAELDKESWAQICDQFDAENPHIGQAAEVAKLLRSNVELTGAAAGLSPQRPATEGSEVERRVGRNYGERNFMYQELNDLKMMADMFVEEGMPEVEKICLTAIGALRTVDDLAKIVMRLAHSLRKATPDNDHAEKALDYLRRKGLIVSPLRETPNA